MLIVVSNLLLSQLGANLPFVFLDDPPFVDLIEKMVKHDAGERPTMAECASHPFFWDAKTALERCRQARGKVDQRVEALDREWIGKWMSLLPAGVVGPMSQKAAYKNSLSDLLRFVDNLSKHLHECEPKLVRTVMGTEEKLGVKEFLERNGLHSDGVAEASTTLPEQIEARSTAMSRAL